MGMITNLVAVGLEKQKLFAGHVAAVGVGVTCCDIESSFNADAVQYGNRIIVGFDCSVIEIKGNHSLGESWGRRVS